MFKNILTVTRKNVPSTAMDITFEGMKDKWLDVNDNTSLK
jgi:hypothetical protein